jgi:CHAT domain-containing protein
MRRKVIYLLSLFLLLALQPSGKPGNPASKWLELYRKADNYFNKANPTEATDSMALAGFEQVIQLLAGSGKRQTDSFLFQSYLKKGILLDVQSNIPAAKDAYLQAAAIPVRNPSMGDSLLFRVYIYVGSNYYNLNNFDSANYFLIQAEGLARRFPGIPETERLYNTLGALHFANGNYLQSRNYFGKALSLIESSKPYDSVFAQGLQANIASSYYKMGLYPEALGIYKKIVRDRNSAAYIYNGICMNMGKAYQALQKFPEALASYHRINPLETPGVWNELAIAHFEQGHYDSAAFFLGKLPSLQQTRSVNLLDMGINSLYRSDLLLYKKEYLPALKNLQSALCAFSSNFNNPDIYSNPKSFSGSYTYYRLFETLQKKGIAFEMLCRSAGTEKYLIASLEAYQAALNLLGFIEKSYDTDDAKFFLKENSREVYTAAISVCLELYRKHPDGEYLDQAFRISEMNKASVLVANLRQRSLIAVPGVDSNYLQTERNIKYNIARLDVQSQQAADNKTLGKLAAEKAGYEIALSQLQKRLEQNNHYFQLKYDESNHGPKELQTVLGEDQAVFNFYHTEQGWHLFAFTRNEFKYTMLEAGDQLQQEISDWIHSLQNSRDGRKFNGKKTGSLLYRHLVKPMQELVPGKAEWIIIPDENLFLLPFESLPADESGKYLLETTTISYQFSSRFLLNLTSTSDNPDYRVLSFAPFAAAGAGKDQLSSSLEEIEGLEGRRFLNGEATKARFLGEMSNYPVLHLATHAMADMQHPATSFIAFYPEKKSTPEDNLFLEEIYGLNLESCKLVIISACETGKGELVSNEGVISLGRAFAYAGCGGTLSSLWKADDKSTAFILRAFHQYVKKGFTTAKALQQAKLDYLDSDALYKGPEYWSNLVFTGNPAPIIKTTKALSTPWIMLSIVFCCVLLIVMLVTGERKKVDEFERSYMPQNLN